MASSAPNPAPSMHTDEEGCPLLTIGPGAGLLFAKHCFPQATETIRLASAYFSLSGYELVRHLIPAGVTLRILIGQKDGPQVQQAVVKEILADLKQCEVTLTAAIQELVTRMEANQFFIREARSVAAGYHCKFYTADTVIGWHGSTNFSRRGLLLSVEQASSVTEPAQLQLLNTEFDQMAAQAYDLLADLLVRLKAWLDMATPFEVYLKALSILRHLDEPPRRPRADLPTHYQQLLIARALRQLREHRGTLIVAATGLGKTILGAEIAAHCFTQGMSRRCLVLGPMGAVHREWIRHLQEDRDLNISYFSLDILFLKDSTSEDHQVEKLRKYLREADEHTLILIDEVHTYRNQWLKEIVTPNSSRVFERLLPALHTQGARVLLLTATVYGTGLSNLTSLLHLLPLQPSTDGRPATVWTARSAAQFANLPVVTVLGIPHVLQLARERGDVDAQGRPFITFGSQRRYLPPELHLYAPRYDLPTQYLMQQALDNGSFDQSTKVLHTYYNELVMRPEKGASDSVFKQTVAAWLSSPAALADGLARTLATPGVRDPPPNGPPAPGKPQPYYYLMKQKQAVRQRVLGPLWQQHSLPDYTQDAKFMLLYDIVRTVCLAVPAPPTSKVLIFVNRRLTATYLVASLQAAFGSDLRVASTVRLLATGLAELRSLKERKRLLRDFAPMAHHRPAGRGPDYHVLICTQADGEGVNLQDASTLVHYDLPGAADELYQRVGRLLRFTSNPDRQISIYTLEPTLAYSDQETFLTVASKSRQAVQELVMRLHRRYQNSRHILLTSVRGETQQTHEPLEYEAVPIEHFLAEPVVDAALEGPAQAELRHTAALTQHRDTISHLAEPLLSARYYSETQPRIIVLVQAEDTYTLLRYNLKTAKLEVAGEPELLQQLACQSTTDKAEIPTNIVEQSAHEAVQAWCLMRQLDIANVAKICALYMAPSSMARHGVRRLLTAQ